MFILFIAIAIFCLTQQKYTKATLFMLVMGLSFLFVISSIIIYMSKDAYHYYSLYNYFGVTKKVQNELMFLPISRYLLIRIMNFSSMLFLFSGLCSAIFFALHIEKHRKLLYIAIALPCLIQVILYDPTVYAYLYFKLYPSFVSSQQFISFYETIHQATFIINTAYIVAGISLVIYALFDAPKVKQIRSTIVMITISYISMQVTYYYINFWAPNILISVSKAADFIRFKPIILVGKPSMYALLPYIVSFCLLFSLYGIYMYARIQNKIKNQEAVISHNIDSATLTSRVFSHFMKNELLAIMVQSEILGEMAIDSPELVKEIKVIENRCQNIYSRLDIIHQKTNSSKMELKPVVLHPLITTVLSEMKEDLKAVNITYHEHSQTLTIMADPYYFSQVLENILSNAVDALQQVPEKTRSIELETIIKNKWVELIIRDNGIGVPDEFKELIFQPFFSSKPTATNWGMGLALCQTIINTHGGQLTLNSKLGEGSSFHIVMPLLRTSIH
ncbi:sensor histidine kinase [Paenibacillus yanchengensis]